MTETTEPQNTMWRTTDYPCKHGEIPGISWETGAPVFVYACWTPRACQTEAYRKMAADPGPSWRYWRGLAGGPS